MDQMGEGFDWDMLWKKSQKAWAKSNGGGGDWDSDDDFERERNKRKEDSMVCYTMKETGKCGKPDCKWCIAMVMKYGTNDPNDPYCWSMRMTGECKAGDK